LKIRRDPKMTEDEKRQKYIEKWKKFKEQDLKVLQDDSRWPYNDMISLINRQNAQRAVLKYANGIYFLVPGVDVRKPFEIPPGARNGQKEFLKQLVDDDWYAS
jgi:hypothetical protein